MPEPDLKVARPLVSLKKLVVKNLRTAIIDGTLPPGGRLVERELCEMLDVSRPLVREALSQLEVEGLVQIIPHRGPIVAAYTDAETISIYEVRAVLEEMAGRLFVEHATDEERRALRRALDEIKQAYRDPSVTDRIAIKSHFYIALAKGTHSPMLVEMLRLIHSRVTWLRRETLAQPGRAKKALAEMTEVVRQIKKGDADAAGRACRRHVENTLAIATRVLSEQSKSPAAETANSASNRSTGH